MRVQAKAATSIPAITARPELGIPGIGVGVGGTAATDWHAENSEVLLLRSVAVAVTTSPTVTVVAKLAVKPALPVPSVVTSLKPRNVSPSP